MHYFSLATKLLEVMPRRAQFQVFEWLRKRLYHTPPFPAPDPRNSFNLHRSDAHPAAAR